MFSTQVSPRTHSCENVPRKTRTVAFKGTSPAVNNSDGEITKEESAAARSLALSGIQKSGKLDAKENAAQYLKTLGIDAEFDNDFQANLTKKAVDDFIKINKDPKMFEGLKISSNDYGDSVTNFGWYADCDKGIFELKLNSGFDWSDIKAKMQHAYDNCKTPSAKPEYAIYEGLGHFLNFKYNPYAYTANANRDDCLNEKAMSCALKISKNADSVNKYNSAYIAARMSRIEYPAFFEQIFLENVGNSELKFPESTPTKKVAGAEHNFTTMDEASEYLETKFGIDAEFVNIGHANLVVSAIEDFVKLNNNPDMFKGLKIAAVNSINQSPNVPGCLYYSYSESKTKELIVKFSKAYDWRRHEEIAKYNYEEGHYASTSPKYTIYHELAHWLDANRNLREYVYNNKKIKAGQGFNDLGKLISGKVSNYAQEDQIEFKAEYVAANMCGLSFPKRVDALYEENNGPELIFP